MTRVSLESVSANDTATENKMRSPQTSRCRVADVAGLQRMARFIRSLHLVEHRREGGLQLERLLDLVGRDVGYSPYSRKGGRW